MNLQGSVLNVQSDIINTMAGLAEGTYPPFNDTRLCLRDSETPCQSAQSWAVYRKGIGLIFPNRNTDIATPRGLGFLLIWRHQQKLEKRV